MKFQTNHRGAPVQLFHASTGKPYKVFRSASAAKSFLDASFTRTRTSNLDTLGYPKVYKSKVTLVDMCYKGKRSHCCKWKAEYFYGDEDEASRINSCVDAGVGNRILTRWVDQDVGKGKDFRAAAAAGDGKADDGGKWFLGTIVDWAPEDGLHEIFYDVDQTWAWLDLDETEHVVNPSADVETKYGGKEMKKKSKSSSKTKKAESNAKESKATPMNTVYKTAAATAAAMAAAKHSASPLLPSLPRPNVTADASESCDAGRPGFSAGSRVNVTWEGKQYPATVMDCKWSYNVEYDDDGSFGEHLEEGALQPLKQQSRKKKGTAGLLKRKRAPGHSELQQQQQLQLQQQQHRALAKKVKVQLEAEALAFKTKLASKERAFQKKLASTELTLKKEVAARDETIEYQEKSFEKKLAAKERTCEKRLAAKQRACNKKVTATEELAKYHEEETSTMQIFSSLQMDAIDRLKQIALQAGVDPAVIVEAAKVRSC